MSISVIEKTFEEMTPAERIEWERLHEVETAIAHYGRMFNALAIVEVASNLFTWRVKDCTKETEAMFRE